MEFGPNDKFTEEEIEAMFADIIPDRERDVPLKVPLDPPFEDKRLPQGDDGDSLD